MSTSPTRLISSSYDKSIKVWNINADQNVSTLLGHSNAVLCLCYITQTLIVSGSTDTTLRVWDLNKVAATRIINGAHKSSVNSLISLKNVHELISASTDHTIKIWCTKNWYCLKILFSDCDWLKCVELIEDTNHLASGSWDRSIKLWDLNTGMCLRTILTDDVECLVSFKNVLD
jgi:WD40 repeat protein